MDSGAQQKLARLIDGQRIGALGTLRDGAPFVSMITYAPTGDFNAFYILASRLAYHTQDFLRDPRISLLITETDTGRGDPQMLARLTVGGSVASIGSTQPEYNTAREVYLKRFPDAARNFELGDFALYAIRPDGGRFVAGFGQTFRITLQDLTAASQHFPNDIP
jgi:putative heme iron utilization protein